jgi:formamidopyrimidine-DNA glycosylase
MPELPEVETIVRMLVPSVEGQRIATAELTLGRLLLGSSPLNFAAKLAGQKILRVVRRGKYIVFELDNVSLIIHLGMTGQLTYSPTSPQEDGSFIRTVTGLQKARGVHPVDKHTHFILHLKGGERVLFRDPRTFGKLILVDGHDWAAHPRLSILGEEPLAVRIKPFLARCYPVASSRTIKSLLLDQSFLSGVGNIYADEALFRSAIHPAQPVRKLSENKRVQLLEAVKQVLALGIKNSGTTFSDYRKPDGTQGSNFSRLQVYGRGGQPCRTCRTTLVKAVVAQRGTVFCPSCQGRKPK